MDRPMLKTGDRIRATRDACFSYNKDVKEGEVFTIAGKDADFLNNGFTKWVEYYELVIE